jgi:hypothetical protein
MRDWDGPAVAQISPDSVMDRAAMTLRWATLAAARGILHHADRLWLPHKRTQAAPGALFPAGPDVRL